MADSTAVSASKRSGSGRKGSACGGKVPGRRQQARQVSAACSSQPAPGDTVFLVPCQWAEQWRSWSSSVSKEDGARLRPDCPIPTGELLPSSRVAATVEIGVKPLLRPGLVEGLHFECWPAAAWALVAGWYSADTGAGAARPVAIPRVVRRGTERGSTAIEPYPAVVDVWQTEIVRQGRPLEGNLRCAVHMGATVGELKALAASEFGVPPERARLWRMRSMGTAAAELDDRDTLIAARVLQRCTVGPVEPPTVHFRKWSEAHALRRPRPI